MYIPPLFREQDSAVLHSFIRQARLATLISNGRDGLPDVSYLPLIFDADDGENGSLLGHLARGNTHWKSLSAVPSAIAIFMGADAYVSPTWYPTKQVHHKHVPTWNYETVHAVCNVEIFDDRDRLLNAVTRLTKRQEDHRADPWTVDQAPPDYLEAQLRGIVGIKLEITELRGKRKMSQNRDAEDRKNVREVLAASPDVLDQAVAASMLQLQVKC